MSTTVDVINFELHEKVAALQEALLTAHPTLPVLLRTIHTQLRADPELVTTLTEDEIGILVNGLKKQTNTEIATAVVKEAKTGTASIKKKIAAAGGSAVDLF